MSQSGDEKDIGMPRGRDKLQAETLDIVDGIVERMNFEFASIAGAGIHFPYGQ